ncbi:hypothetical protein [Pseudomonas sp.]|uniref:hypothetical protein n=1 Tax=Pseudomonas sp. TaxID=306 RepID=UPI003266D84D
MSSFSREDRYVVIKRSDLEKIPNRKSVNNFLAALADVSANSCRIPQRKFLIIESDWPEYEPTWRMIEDRVAGKTATDIDSRSLSCARKIMAHIKAPVLDGQGGFAQLQAKIQCEIIELLSEKSHDQR